MLFPFLLLSILKWIDSFGGSALSVPAHLSSWFGFWGSYLGLLVSIALTFITIRLTFVIDSMGKDENERQHRLSVATNMPNFVCESVHIYDMNRDYAYQYFALFKDIHQFIWSFTMTPAFPPYFKTTISQMHFKCFCFEAYNQSLVEADVDINPEDYYYTNNAKFELAINMRPNSKLDMILTQFYNIQLLSTEGTPFESTLLELWITFQCENVLLPYDEFTGNVKFKFYMQLENKGKDSHAGQLVDVINRKLERI